MSGCGLVTLSSEPPTFFLLVIPIFTQGHRFTARVAARKVLLGFQDILVLLDSEVTAGRNVHVDLC